MEIPKLFFVKISIKQILCFASITSITIITAVVNLQLLRLGLVNHTTIGLTFQKETKDVYILIGLVIDACEILVCTATLIICLKLNYDSKNNRFKSQRKEGVFFVQIVSDKDIVVVQSSKKRKYQRNVVNKRSQTSKNHNSKKKINNLALPSKSQAFIGDAV